MKNNFDIIIIDPDTLTDEEWEVNLREAEEQGRIPAGAGSRILQHPAGEGPGLEKGVAGPERKFSTQRYHQSKLPRL